VELATRVPNGTAQTHPQWADFDQLTGSKSDILWQLGIEVNAQMSGNSNWLHGSRP
jgi:hypothetical protein